MDDGDRVVLWIKEQFRGLMGEETLGGKQEAGAGFGRTTFSDNTACWHLDARRPGLQNWEGTNLFSGCLIGKSGKEMGEVEDKVCNLSRATWKS